MTGEETKDREWREDGADESKAPPTPCLDRVNSMSKTYALPSETTSCDENLQLEE